MRVLFYTAAAIAATIASLGQAIKLEATNSLEDDFYSEYDDYSQIDALVTPASPNQDRQV